MKAKSLIVSLILIVCFAGIGIGLYCAWPAITGTITNSKYYTSEDLQDAYDKGYDDAFKNKDELTQQVDYYKELTDTYYISILDYQAQIKDYETLTENNQNTISTLEQNKIELQSQVDNLTSIKNENEQTINSLTSDKSLLQTQVDNLQDEIANKELIIESLNLQISTLKSSIQDKTNEIIELNNQVNNLQSQLNNLQNDNSNLSSEIEILETNIADKQSQIDSLNLEINNLEESLASTEQLKNEYYNKISTLEDEIEQNLIQIQNLNTNIDTLKSTQNVLNERVTSLNSTIEELNITLEEKNNNILRLNDKISKLTENLLSLQTFIVNLQLNDKCVATFEYNEDIYNIQVVEKNSLLNITNPADTDYIKFNGWTINGEIVDLSTYQITANTTFVADLTYIYDVEFIYYDDVDGVSTRIVYDSQKVEENSYVDMSGVLGSSPVYSDMIFRGWTLDGNTIIDVSIYPIIENTTFIAKFISPNYVTFQDETTSKTFSYDPNQEFDFITNNPFETNRDKLIIGWSINGGIYNNPNLSEISFNKNLSNILISPIYIDNYTGAYTIDFSGTAEFGGLTSDVSFGGEITFDVNYNNSKRYFIENIVSNNDKVKINSFTFSNSVSVLTLNLEYKHDYSRTLTFDFIIRLDSCTINYNRFDSSNVFFESGNFNRLDVSRSWEC